MKKRPVVAIVGPTAVGKSKAALILAEKFAGEIVSCDAMQVYREINIVSNKPSPEEQAAAVHHLIDIVSVEDEFNVAAFNNKALQTIEEIDSRDSVPIIVGGSGMYLQVLMDGIFEESRSDEDLRVKLKEEAEEKGWKEMHTRLKQVDPDAASKIHPNDKRRVIRALEICLLEERPFSEVKQKRQGIWGTRDIFIFGLNNEREALYNDINLRVDRMFDRGLVEEIRSLEGLSLSRTAKGLIGIPEIQGFLQEDYDEDEAKYLMKLHTRHFAKRQLTWFRKDERINWIMKSEFADDSAIVEMIAKESRLLQ